MSLYLQPLFKFPVTTNFQLWIKHQGNAASIFCHTEQVMHPDGYGWPQMVSISRLSSEFSKQSKILVGLNLSFTLPEDFQKNHFSVPSMACFASLYDDTGSSDVIVKAENVEVRAHRAVLAAHSPSFKAMFTAGMTEQQTGEVMLQDTQGDVLEAFLSFMYGKLKKVPDHLLLPLFMLADAHQVASLRSMTLDALLSTVNQDNVFDYIVAADSCNEQTLMQACTEYGAQNSASTVGASKMQQLMEKNAALAQKFIVSMISPKQPAK